VRRIPALLGASADGRAEFFTAPALNPILTRPSILRRLALTLPCLLCFVAARPSIAASGTPFDLQGFLDRQIQSGARHITVPPGRYRVTPRDRQHLRLGHLANLEITADGVEMVCTETTRALTISRCTNVTVRGLTIDYDPLPFTEGVIKAVSADHQLYDVELFGGYPTASHARNFKYEVFQPGDRTLRCEDRYLSSVEVVDDRHLKLTSPGSHDTNPEQVGDLVVIGAEDAPGGSIPHAVECDRNSGVRLSNIRLFASNCFGFIETRCDASVYDNCAIGRRPPGEDPVAREAPRLRSLDADAFHSKYAVRGPSYLGCRAEFMGDDAINICGDYHMVMESTGATLRVLAKGAMNIEAGDPVEICLDTGERLPDARAVAVRPDGRTRDTEQEFLSHQALDARLKSGEGLRDAWTITLDREVALPRGSVLCAANQVGNGFQVRGCHFGFNRSRGILIKASQGVVADNHLEGCWMSAILVSPEYWWLEAGSSVAVSITGNTVSNCRGIPIRIEAAGAKGEIAPAGAHRDIRVEGNRIAGCAMPGILVTSTAGLRIGSNDMSGWVAAGGLPEPMRRAGLKELKPVIEIRCTP